MADLETLACKYEAAKDEMADCWWDLIEAIRSEHAGGASLAALMRQTGLDSPTLMAMLSCQSPHPIVGMHSPDL